MIIDGHAHVSPTSYGSAEQYVEVMRQAGIRKAVVSPGGMLDVRRMSEYVSGGKKAAQAPTNDYVAEAVRSRPELVAFACVDPRDPRAPETVERLWSAGFRGLLISPLVHAFSFADEAVSVLAALSGDRGVPMISHCAWRPGAMTIDFVALARRFPRTNFILEHMGAPPADVDAVDGAAELDNFFLETSLCSFLPVSQAVKHVGASKIIFGSEYPLSHPALELQKIRLLPVTERERDRILGENIRELLRLDGDRAAREEGT